MQMITLIISDPSPIWVRLQLGTHTVSPHPPSVSLSLNNSWVGDCMKQFQSRQFVQSWAQLYRAGNSHIVTSPWSPFPPGEVIFLYPELVFIATVINVTNPKKKMVGSQAISHLDVILIRFSLENIWSIDRGNYDTFALIEQFTI